MSATTTVNAAEKASNLHRTIQHVAKICLSAIAILYAFAAGLRTVADPDTGWQLATGRWIIEHHSIPRVDVLSFTAAGKEWIYPALSQVSFYLLYRLGGYSLLSWFCAAACVFIVYLLVRVNMATGLLTILLVPLIAARTAPRAELYTELFFTLFVTILWKHLKDGQGRLWLLPILMAFWANTHLGYMAGLAMCAAYVLFALENCVAAEKRATAVKRLRSAGPWMIAAFLATFLNPWGAESYIGMFRLAPIQSNRWVQELGSVHITKFTLHDALAWRDPDSALWALMLIALFAIVCGLLLKRIAAPLVLATSLYLVMHSIRFQALFGIIVVVIGGSAIAEAAGVHRIRTLLESRVANFRTDAKTLITVLSVLIVGVLSAVRTSDLVTGRTYFRQAHQGALFGPGLSQWFPEQAAGFLKLQHLPGNVFNDYNSGGFVAWALLPEYADYIDGRGTPFGNELFFRSLELLDKSPDSPEWQRETQRWNLNTILISVDPGMGSGLNSLTQFCESQSWRPVFLDTAGAVFVRVQPENAAAIKRLEIDCSSIKFDNPPTSTGLRGRAERFRYYRNAVAIYTALGNFDDALKTAALAEPLFPDDPILHRLRGTALALNGSLDQAKVELARSVELAPTEESYRMLANLYKRQGRFIEAARTLDEATQRFPEASQLFLELGFAQASIGMPGLALNSFAQAEKWSPFPPDSRTEGTLGGEFYGFLADGKMSAWMSVADIYDSQGLRSEAQQARTKAREIMNSREASTIH